MALEIFFCYAHEDEALRKELEKHLRALKRQRIIDIWHDREIRAGAEWEREIDRHLNTAKIILLLISPDFMDSDYCYSQEMLRAMERHERGDARVIPVILRPVYWQGAPFGKLQALPTDAKAIISRHWHHLDEAFFDVAEGIRKAALELAEPSTTELLLSKASNPTIVALQMVVDAWERVRKRAKQKSALLATYMAFFEVIAIEGTADQPVVVIQAMKATHLKNLKDANRNKDLEWALQVEFDLTSCQVRIVAPDVLPQAITRMETEREATPIEDKSVPTLTVPQIARAWENVRKRTKQKSALLATYMAFFEVVAIEGTSEQPVVVLQAKKSSYYQYVMDEERYKDLEWALTVEFGHQCKVRLVPLKFPANTSLIADGQNQ